MNQSAMCHPGERRSGPGALTASWYCQTSQVMPVEAYRSRPKQ